MGNSSNFLDNNSFEFCTCMNCPQHAHFENAVYPAAAINDLSQINTKTFNTTKANPMNNFVDNIKGNDNKLILKPLGIKNDSFSQQNNVTNNFIENDQTLGDNIENLDQTALDMLSESLSSVKINSDDLQLFDSIYCSKQ